MQGVAANQHKPGEGDADGVEPSDLVHINPATAGSTGHQGLPQQGEVGRDQVQLHHPHPRHQQCLDNNDDYARFSLPANVFISSGLEASLSSQSVDTSLLGSGRWMMMVMKLIMMMIMI